jgi:hypothetical protein
VLAPSYGAAERLLLVWPSANGPQNSDRDQSDIRRNHNANNRVKSTVHWFFPGDSMFETRSRMRRFR